MSHGAGQNYRSVVGQWVRLSELDNDEAMTLLAAHRMPAESTRRGIIVVRSIADTSHAARRRPSPYARGGISSDELRRILAQ